MDFKHEMKEKHKQMKDGEEQPSTVEFEEEQQRQRDEVGEDIIEKIKQIIHEKFPEMEGVEPIITDERFEKVAPNILERLKEVKTTDTEVDEMEKAWKSLLFRKDVTQDEMELIRRIIAVINRHGDLLRVVETIG